MVSFDDTSNWIVVMIDVNVGDIDVRCVPYADSQLSVQGPAQRLSIERDGTSDNFGDVEAMVVFLEVLIMRCLALDIRNVSVNSSWVSSGIDSVLLSVTLSVGSLSVDSLSLSVNSFSLPVDSLSVGTLSLSVNSLSLSIDALAVSLTSSDASNSGFAVDMALVDALVFTRFVTFRNSMVNSLSMVKTLSVMNSLDDWANSVLVSSNTGVLVSSNTGVLVSWVLGVYILPLGLRVVSVVLVVEVGPVEFACKRKIYYIRRIGV